MQKAKSFFRETFLASHLLFAISTMIEENYLIRDIPEICFFFDCNHYCGGSHDKDKK